jgi:hypothetical protein
MTSKEKELSLEQKREMIMFETFDKVILPDLKQAINMIRCASDSLRIENQEIVCSLQEPIDDL